MDWTSPTDLAATSGALIGVGTALYMLYDKVKTRWEISNTSAVKLEAERAANEAARAKTAAEAWEYFAAERQKVHEKDVARLEAEIADNRKEIRSLNNKLSNVSGLEQQIVGLKDENEQMKTAFRRMGMWPDDDMPPWLPGQPDRRIEDKSSSPGSGRWYVGPERRVDPPSSQRVKLPTPEEEGRLFGKGAEIKPVDDKTSNNDDTPIYGDG